AAAWELPLTPRPNHWDRRITVQTPLKKAGAYLLTATLPDGNTSRIVLWVADSALVQKPVQDGTLYFAADAVTGQPLANARIELFGWRQRWVEDTSKTDAKGRRRSGGGHNEVRTVTRTGATNADGLFTDNLWVKERDGNSSDYQWLATLTTPAGRFAYLGFNSVWGGSYYEAEYNETKAYVMTDRPVYRPGQTVKFKAWLNQAQYDREGKSPFAGRSQVVRIFDPRNEKLFEQALTADAWGGVAGELALPKGATLGVCRIEIVGSGGGNFRVEEYKKPEFEVTVDAPKEPVMLGETVTATVAAKYYFGAPVAEGKVAYKVLRTPYSADWYPARYWDWFYGPGYWWFAHDYDWLPGWREWGTPRPACVWWPEGWRQSPPPEVVAEGEAPVGRDGRFQIRFDTAAAKLMHGDTDHQYAITAEVTDASRRTIVGTGTVLVARRPFKVHAWVDRGWYRAGDVIRADFKALTLDRQPVAGSAMLRLYRVRYVAGQPAEALVQDWRLRLDDAGTATRQLKAAEAGQYRLSLTVTDRQGHAIEGGYVFSVMGEAAGTAGFRFDDLELTADRAEYRPGENVLLRVNTNRENAAVLLFLRPANGVYLKPKLLRLNGKSISEAVAVAQKDMPNFFIEAVTVGDGKVYQEVREIAVPPEQRVLNVAVTPGQERYQPGEKARLTVKLTGLDGRPYVGSTVLTLYDKAVEYIAGGSNVPDIKEFFWKWRRNHRTQGWSSLDRGSENLQKSGELGMGWIGVFGQSLADEEGVEQLAGGKGTPRNQARSPRHSSRMMAAKSMAFEADAPMPCAAPAPGAPGMMMADAMVCKEQNAMEPAGGGAAEGEGAPVQPAIRSNFADTALWAGTLDTDANGEARVELAMPENLTTWKARVWAMGDGCRVGEGAAETVTAKNVIVRLQAPRFFVQKDEVTLSANIHNYLPDRKKVTARLEIIELDGARATALDAKIERARPDRWTQEQTVTVAAGGEARADWRIRLDQPGRLTVRVSALTDAESDAMEQTFPVYVHGMEKVESFSGLLRATATSAALEFTVPQERRPAETRLEIRWSPTLAGAMVDALPYLVDYPYGCTEQTLNRFLPTVVTQHTLLRMGLNLKEIGQKRTNLNAQEIGDPAQRAADWRRNNPPNPGECRNPVFDEATVRDMVQAGLERLASMQCADGGWGWFSGAGEQSWPHTTALVVHGLQVGRECGAPVPDALLNGGVAWLKGHQAEQVRRLK
ncbi:MAG: MG2 domain-containing protein, partial [Lentisphaeria bacterium]